MVTVWPDRHDVQIVIERITVFEDRIEVKLKADVDAILRSAELTEASILREQSESKNPALDSSAGPQNDRNGSAADVSDAVPFEITIIEEALHRADRVFTVHAVSEGDPSGTKRRLAGALRDAVPHDFGSGTGRGIAANRCEFGFAEFLL